MIGQKIESQDVGVISALSKFRAAKSVWDALQARFADAVKKAPGSDEAQKKVEASEREYKDAEAELSAP